MGFEFATATRIVFGWGSAAELGAIASALGQRVLLVRGRGARPADAILARLESAGLNVQPFVVSGEPTTELVVSALAAARGAQCEVVVAVGGGSALDLGKATAALLRNPGVPLDYLEVVGRAQPLAQPSAPFVAVPTTAGTGAEVTRNAVLLSREHGVKASLRNPWLLPAVALVDPELTLSVPAPVTASTGMDALTQLIEPFVSKRANPFVDALCRDGIARAAQSLPRAFHHGDDRGAREDMALASLLGGLALANAALGAVHGFAAVLGGLLGAPHGALCACLLPHVMAANIAALEASAPERSRPPALERYDEIAGLLSGDTHARAEDGVRRVAALCAELGIPSLRDLGLCPADLERVAALTEQASSLKGNPVALGRSVLCGILERALGA